MERKQLQSSARQVPAPPPSRGTADRLAATGRLRGPVTPNTSNLQARLSISNNGSHVTNGSGVTTSASLPPQIAFSHPPAYDTAQHGPRAIRLSNQLRDRFEAMKVLAHAFKKTELCDVTHAMLNDWSTKLLKAVSDCDEIVANLPTRIADMDVATLHGGGLGGGGGGGGGRRGSVASKQGSVSPAMLSPKDNAFAFPPIHLNGTTNSNHPFSGGNTISSIISGMIPDSGSLSYTLQATAEPAVERMRNLALSIHMCLDSASRSINSERASICMPVRGVKEDLRSVCSTGFANEDHQSYRPTHTSPESLCMQSGLMVVCSNGTNPPVELDMRSALAFFQDASNPSSSSTPGGQTVSPRALHLNDTTSINEELAKQESRPVPRTAAAMMSRAAQQRPPPLSASATFHPAVSMNAPNSVAAAAAGKGSGVGPTIVTSLKSRYWSKIICPLRLTNTSPILGVVTFLNKDKGNNNFSTDDETIVFGAASTLAALLARCNDTELLSRCFEKHPAVPPFPAHLSSSVTVPGSRTQLVYRTKEPSGGKDIRILVADGKSERLDSHTSLMAVSDYIQRMQQSWKDAVLLNAELRRTHEERTRVVTSLLVRARTSELRNTVLEKERVALIPEDDDHNAKHFRDYAQFKKHRARLEELLQEEAKDVSEQRRDEEQRLRERQSERQRKYNRGASLSAAASAVMGRGGGSIVDASALASVMTGHEFGSDDDDFDVYAQSAGGNNSNKRREKGGSPRRTHLQRKDSSVATDDDELDDPGEDLVVSPPAASPTPSASQPRQGRSPSTTAADRRVSTEVGVPPNIGGGGSLRASVTPQHHRTSGDGTPMGEVSFEASQTTPQEDMAGDVVEGDAPELAGVLLKPEVSFGGGGGENIVFPAPGVSVTPAAAGRTSRQQAPPQARRASDQTPPLGSRAASGGALSGQPTPADSVLSQATTEGGTQPVKRDRRLSRQAKELLFGKEQLPPALL